MNTLLVVMVVLHYPETATVDNKGGEEGHDGSCRFRTVRCSARGALIRMRLNLDEEGVQLVIISVNNTMYTPNEQK